MDPRRRFGNEAESLAAEYLKKKGYRILCSQYRTRFGEIDLVAEQGSEIVFVEVKARRTNDFGFPEESVTQAKLEKIFLAGEMYLRETKSEKEFRVDVIAIDGGGFVRRNNQNCGGAKAGPKDFIHQHVLSALRQP